MGSAVLTRYFVSEPHVEQVVRDSVMRALGQPNGYADSPWSPGGDFTFDGKCYVSIEAHHAESRLWQEAMSAAIQLGLLEISGEQYYYALSALSHSWHTDDN